MPSVLTRLLHKLHRDTSSECWLWIGYKRGGYGRMTVSGTTKSTHRVAYELFVGPVPPGMDVLHTCDTTACCNPAHLYAGTHAHNMRDRASRGRQPNATASLELARELRLWYAIGGWKQSDLAEAFCLSKQTVNDIIRGKTYR